MLQVQQNDEIKRILRARRKEKISTIVVSRA